IAAERQSRNGPMFFTRRYGKKYEWNEQCPCCNDAEERDNHVLHDCEHTKATYNMKLRSEVIEEMRAALGDETAELDRLPAWFTCGDDLERARYNSDEKLVLVANYDKKLGALAYIPIALVEWMRVRWTAREVDNTVHAAQRVLVKRAHTIWNERCK